MKIHNTYLFGKSCDKAFWTPAELERIGRRARAAAARMRAARREYIVDTLARAAAAFAPGGKYREAALSHLKENVSFSAPVIARTLDAMGAFLTADAMNKRLELELFLPAALDGAVERPGYAGLLRAWPRGVALHVGAGNVFLGILDSLVLGLLTRNANIVKISSSGSNFISLFMRALEEADREGTISGSVAVVGWKGGTQALEEAAMRHADTVFVWGGYDAVQAYRRLAPQGVRVEGFGPKTSVGVAYASCVDAKGMPAVARRAALDASLWDQAACSSLHTLYIVAPPARHRALAREFIACASAEFGRLAAELPPGRLSVDEMAEVGRARGLAAADRALGAAEFAPSAPGAGWTVIWEKDPVYRVSPQNRVLYVKTVENIAQVRDCLLPLRGYVQTVGVAGAAERSRTLEALAPAGIARVARLGSMLAEETGSPHDGIFPMMSLVDWLPVEALPSAAERLSSVVELAREKSPFYRRHFRGVPPVSSEADFLRLPFLDKDHMLANTPPASSALLTGGLSRGIFFASGGSTGQPKYVFYGREEFDYACKMLGRAMEAGGLAAGDRVANLFIAGNLWSGWLIVEGALANTGAVSVPLGSSLPLESIAKYLQEFGVTAIVGLPSFLLKLAEFVKAARGKYRFPLKHIFYGGEYVGAEMVRFFEGVFPGVKVSSAAYATADAMVVGYQCPRCVFGQHHLFTESHYIEFVSQETLKPVKRGEVGEMVVTALFKRRMPLIRYRVGDLGRWLTKPCACGRPEPVFEILGRCDDRIHVGGAHLFVNDIQEAVGRVHDFSFNFQVVIAKKGHRDTLTIRAEVKDGAALARAGELGDLLWREIMRHCEDLYESVRMGWLDKPRIEVLSPGAIERVARTGKIRRVLDRRQGL